MGPQEQLGHPLASGSLLGCGHIPAGEQLAGVVGRGGGHRGLRSGVQLWRLRILTLRPQGGKGESRCRGRVG